MGGRGAGMSDYIQALARLTLVGTGRAGAALPEPPTLLQTTLAGVQAQSPTPEAFLLRAAGVAAVTAAAGWLPQTAVALPERCTAEFKAILPAALQGLVADLLGDSPLRLQWQVLALLARQGYVLPPSLLPTALDIGLRQEGLRAPILPVLGQRGQWLARQNSAWSWAAVGPAAETDFAWDDAVHEQRLHWLRTHIATTPALARERIVAALPQSSARERLQLLGSLLPQLVPADEGLLQGLLADRAKDIRQTAAAALAQLPGSALALRMGERLAVCLHRTASGWELNPPNAWDPAWKADTLDDEKPPHEALGQRAWWLYQLVRLTPLAWWTRYTGMKPAQLLAWASQGDWTNALLRGWLRALEQQAEADWVMAWLDFNPPKGVTVDGFALVALLPVAEREPGWARLLLNPESLPFSERLGLLLKAVPPELEVQHLPLADAIVQGLEEKAVRRDYSLLMRLPELASLLPLARLPRACELLRLELQEAGRHEPYHRFIALAEQRQRLHSALEENPP